MERRDKIGVIVWLCVMLAATIGIEIRERWTWRLFGDLQQEDVVSIDVVLGAYRPYQIRTSYLNQVSKADQVQIVECLQQIEVSVRVSSDIYPFYLGKDGGGYKFWSALLHMKDGPAILLDIKYPGKSIIINDERDYICHNSDLAAQIYDICESYVERIHAANQTTS